jgi:hypothetical protein
MLFVRCATLFAAALVLWPATGRADVVVNLTETHESGQPPRDMQVLLQPDRMRATTPRGAMIYRDDRKTVWLLDDREHRYTEMTPQTMNAARQGMDQAMRQMQEQLKTMPEAQRRQIEQMMAQRGMPGGPAPSAAVTYVKRATGQTVGRWRCDVFEQQTDGKKTAELCLAPLGDLGLKSDDIKVLNAFYSDSGFAQATGGRAEQLNFKRLSEVAGREVFPIRTVLFDGQKQSETVVKSIERTAIPANSFELPAGYAKRDMPIPGAPKG